MRLTNNIIVLICITMAITVYNVGMLICELLAECKASLNCRSLKELEQHKHHSVIFGHHIYKDFWSPYTGEQLTPQHEDSNTPDRHAVVDEAVQRLLYLLFAIFMIRTHLANVYALMKK